MVEIVLGETNGIERTRSFQTSSPQLEGSLELRNEKVSGANEHYTRLYAQFSIPSSVVIGIALFPYPVDKSVVDEEISLDVNAKYWVSAAVGNLLQGKI